MVVGDDAHQLLTCPTPDAWLAAAPHHLSELLIDHANCERKAAATALGLIHRYPESGDLVHRMSRLAREELRHFEQVVATLKACGFSYGPLTASRYAAALKTRVAGQEPLRLLDTLLVGALIEARSFERFTCLVEVLDQELSAFYGRLLESERRHLVNYLDLARAAAPSERVFDGRLKRLQACEAELITAPDTQFRFHSGDQRAGAGVCTGVLSVVCEGRSRDSESDEQPIHSEPGMASKV